MNAGLKLLKKPEKQQAPMAALELAASLANGDRALPLLRHSVLLFLQEGRGEHRQGPEAQESGGAHQLVVIQAQLFLAIFEEDLDVEAGRRCAGGAGLGWQQDRLLAQYRACDRGAGSRPACDNEPLSGTVCAPRS